MQYYGVYHSPYISHHGILGMKWGVRRYQNKDGSLTEAGKKRRANKLYKTLNERDQKEVEKVKKEISEAGIKQGIFSDRLMKGMTLTRYSDKENEPLDNSRKYVSVTPNDNRVYEMDAFYGGLGFKPDNGVYDNKYTATKPIKIAKADAVMKYLVGKYGDKDVKDAYKFYKKNRINDQYYKLNEAIRNKSTSKADYDAHEYAAQRQTKVVNFLHDAMYDKTKFADVQKRYRKRKYDAIVDPEDYARSYYYPLILLDPASSVKQTSSTKSNYWDE